MKKTVILSFVIALVLTSCTSTKTAEAQLQQRREANEYLQNFYDEAPISIVIMPPINKTNHVEVKEYLYTTLNTVLSEKGFYVFSPMLTMNMFQAESAYDSEEFLNADLSKFHEVLGADAVLFTSVNSWKKYYYVTSAGVIIDIDYVVRSTKTGQILYKQHAYKHVETSVSLHLSGFPIVGYIADAIATAISTAATKKINVARMCNYDGLFNMHQGTYSPTFEVDREAIVKSIAKEDSLINVAQQKLDKKVAKKSKKE